MKKGEFLISYFLRVKLNFLITIGETSGDFYLWG